ncbi:MAG: hypothetical protein HYX69_11000 [Planctomycetia bacterium]|nr:hypothetical protein [Planctomycetia bacterium]
MKQKPTIAAVLLLLWCCYRAGAAEPNVLASSEKKLNNVVATLLDVSGISQPSSSFKFARPRAGWIFASARCGATGSVKIALDRKSEGDTLVVHASDGARVDEAVRYVAGGEHQIHVDCADGATVEQLVVRAIPELIHCGLGFNSAIKSYGLYDMEFLKKDVLPNITTTIVPNNIELPQSVIDDWHRQGKRFVAEVGINAQAKTADEHFAFWAAFLDRAPFLDGIIINEFIVNNPSNRPAGTVSPERQKRIDEEQSRHRDCEAAIKRMHNDDRYRNKTVYAYVGGSGKKLNQEMIGPTFVRSLIDSDCRIALERYIFEVSNEQASQDALQTFVDGIADWEAKEPGVKQHMVVAFGLFSMPPGGINKQPNVDYHVWMDQQMNLVANDPQLAGLAGVEWWTSILADEETVRFVGKLYRHYGIEGKTEMLTRDPLFLAHIQNADFEQGLAGWTLQPAEEGAIAAKSFPRYGRIEGRYMGLGRPADPEHIGDTFLWMKRSANGPNTFSQTIKNLEPGRLYSLKMLTCDYQDLVNPQKKTEGEAQKFQGRVTLAGVELDEKRSFSEIYPSSPEPPIPVWITYHWKIFRAKAATAKLTVSDWPSEGKPDGPFGQEQTFNFLELQPYHE